MVFLYKGNPILGGFCFKYSIFHLDPWRDPDPSIQLPTPNSNARNHILKELLTSNFMFCLWFAAKKMCYVM